MPNSVALTRTALVELERTLRQYEAELCAGAVRNYQATLQKQAAFASSGDPQAMQSGSGYVHRLIIVAVALYPSEITVRREYQWASTGMLRRHGIGYEHQAALLTVYCNAVRTLNILKPEALQALDIVEQFMLRIVYEVYSSEV